MISIDISDLKDEITPLKEFLAKKLSVEVRIEDKIVKVGTAEDTLSRSNVKEYIERFFYRKNLSNLYKVLSEKEAIKIIKKKK